MTKAILYDGFHATASMGTGLATYARQLKSAAHELGYRTDALVSVEYKVDRRAPLLAEIGMFDAQAERFRLVRQIMAKITTYPGAPFGIRPLKLRVRGTVSGHGALSGYDHVLVSKRTYQRATANFSRYGRFATVRVPKGTLLFHATFPMPVRVAGHANLVTIHDLIPLRLPYSTLDNKRFYYSMVKTAAHKADHIVTVSEHSRRDIIEMLDVPEHKVTNTYQAVTIPQDVLDRPMDEVTRDLANSFGLEPGGYFLFVGAVEPKKNIGRLIDAYALSGSKRPLVLAGGLGWQFKDDLARIQDERFLGFKMAQEASGMTGWIDRRIRRLPFVPFDLLTSLIKGARALLFPSLYEGFGLPVLEAMAFGRAVLTSNSTSLPEVAGDAGILVNPYDIRSIAAGIRELDNDDARVAELGLRGVQRAKLFAPDVYAKKLEAVYSRFTS